MSGGEKAVSCFTKGAEASPIPHQKAVEFTYKAFEGWDSPLHRRRGRSGVSFYRCRRLRLYILLILSASLKDNKKDYTLKKMRGHRPRCPCGCGGEWPVENLAVDKAVLKSNLIFNGSEGDSPPESVVSSIAWLAAKIK